MVVAGNRGLPGSGTNALFGLRGATLVRMTLVLLRKVARRDALLTPGMQGVSEGAWGWGDICEGPVEVQGRDHRGAGVR